MKVLVKWYVVIATLVFTFGVNIAGRSPAGWALHALSAVAREAPRLASF
jgi:hypothetical protein